MAIITSELFDAMAKKHGGSDASEEFTTSFFLALKRTIEDLNSNRVGLSLSTPVNMDSNIDADDYYISVLLDGIDHYLERSGQWGGDTSAEIAAIYEQSIRRAHGQRISSLTTDDDHWTRLGEVS